MRVCAIKFYVYIKTLADRKIKDKTIMSILYPTSIFPDLTVSTETINTSTAYRNVPQAALTDIVPASPNWIATSDSCTEKDLVVSIDTPRSSSRSGLDLLQSTSNVTPSRS